MEVFKVKKTLTRKDDKKHFYFPFVLDKDYFELVINFKYFPKYYDDKEASIDLLCAEFERAGVCMSREDAIKKLPIGNLLTVSLDGPFGHIGNAHNQKNDIAYIINKEKSSYGFLNIDVVKGEYVVAVSTHSVVTDAVEFEVIIEVKE
ncbi:MAG: hypothetical protein GX959_05905 [Clostridiales bacterium]|jgi:hypothetical protein|nr:hypothetical protein [Clostridiales bacterium]